MPRICTTMTVWGSDPDHLLHLRQQSILTLLTVNGQALEDPDTPDWSEGVEVGPIIQCTPTHRCFAIHSVANGFGGPEDFAAISEARRNGSVVVTLEAGVLPE